MSQNTNDLRIQVTYDMVILSVWAQDAWILVAEMLEGKILDGIHLMGIRGGGRGREREGGRGRGKRE